ncbi:MAG: branched-chain amino acid ABC transporter permease [Thermoprotei archaeon]
MFRHIKEMIYLNKTDVLILIIFEIITIILFIEFPVFTPVLFIMLEYLVLTYSINMITGFTGYVDFGHIVFYGIGAYATAVAIENFYMLQINPYIFSIIGGIIASAFALLIGTPILKVRGAYFAIATLGMNEAMKVLISNTAALGGSYGIPLARYVKYDPISSYISMWILLLITMVMTLYISNSKFGYGLRSIYENEDAAEALGVNTRLYKLSAYALSAFIAGIAGGISGILHVYISTEGYFDVTYNVKMLVAMMLGGQGTIIGPLIGGIILYTIEYTTLVSFANIHPIIFGVLLIGLVLFMPRGIMGVIARKFRFLR